MKKVIAIDGGGIKGIVPAYILHKIEEEMQEQLTEVVDLVAGTSTGAILAGSIARGLPMSKVLDFYQEEGPEIFKIAFKHRLRTFFSMFGGKYDIKVLEEKLKSVFGELTMDELYTDFLCTSYNMSQGKPAFFTKKNKSTPVYKFIAASSAAPTYFKPVKIDGNEYVDGGLFANNPAMAAFTEVKTVYNSRAENIFLLSVGTGAKNYTNKNVGKWFKLKWLGPLFGIMMSADSGTVHYQLTRIYKAAGKSDNYYRINEFLTKDMSGKLDDAGPESIKELLNFAKYVAKKNKRKIEAVAEFLKSKS